MAQQLMLERTPQAYAGVAHYAQTHPGEAAATAYLALGQAYLLDGKFPQAAASFQRSARAGEALSDYADYLGAKALFAAQQYPAADDLVQNFAARHPDSVLIPHANLLLAKIHLGEGDPQSALHDLANASSLAGSAEYIFTEGRARQLAGDVAEAQRLYTQLYLDDPLSEQAPLALQQLHDLGLTQPFTFDQRVRHADRMYAAGRYAVAASEYDSLAGDADAAGKAAEANLLRARTALAMFHVQRHVDTRRLAQLTDADGEAGAIRLYLTMEAARDRKDATGVQDVIGQMMQRFPQSGWTEEALLSAGNMAMLANDLPTAVRYYSQLATAFPHSRLAPSTSWRAAWLTYRMGDKAAAARLFDAQIARYPYDSHVAAALYWRGVVYQEVEKNPAAAAAYYHRIVAAFCHYYYATVAEQRLRELGPVTPDPEPALARITAPPVETYTEEVPQDSVHVERARLLANAGLNQYIAPEMSAAPDSAEWRAYAEAQLYSSYGESWRALQVLKRKVHSYFARPLDTMPRSYWNMLFPEPYWSTLQQDALAQGLDPYLVASLIRQESEFDPEQISYANAWGLMQLLPSVGRQMARREHVRPFRTEYLLNPNVNLKLGTAYFASLMQEFHGQPEYALAAYNAGDDRVKAWLANGPYASLPEFVESIPFTQTRDYVQAILRNRVLYEKLYSATPAAAAEVRVSSMQ
jgi:soluble lytic murein transglycosylase